ncbi:MAG: transcriptional regulator GcvA [Rhodobacterales bacterium]|nr:transcriptional regulator GcvA [Rhodobacterales bacterium]
MSIRLPSLAALTSFEASARLLSFRRAADELNLTPSAISHQIKGLEDDLGVRLFLRTGKGLQLSEAGATYFPSVRDALERLAEATRDLRRREGWGTLTISLLPTFASRWLIPRLMTFQQMHPGLDLRLSTTVELADFRTDDVDAAIRWGLGTWDGVDSLPLMEEVLVPVCAPEVGRRLRSPRDLAHETLLHNRYYPDAWRMWLVTAGVEGVDPDQGQAFDDGEMVRTAAVSGLGVGMGQHPVINADVAAGNLVIPFDLSLSGGGGYYLVWPPEKAADPNLILFRDWLVREVAEDSLRQSRRRRPRQKGIMNRR